MPETETQTPAPTLSPSDEARLAAHRYARARRAREMVDAAIEADLARSKEAADVKRLHEELLAATQALAEVGRKHAMRAQLEAVAAEEEAAERHALKVWPAVAPDVGKTVKSEHGAVQLRIKKGVEVLDPVAAARALVALPHASACLTGLKVDGKLVRAIVDGSKEGLGGIRAVDEPSLAWTRPE